MKRRLNVKLIAALFVGALVFGGGVHLLHGFQVKRNAQGLINRAEKAREDGDLTESVRLLARYLNHYPEDKVVAKQAALDAKKNLFDLFAERKDPGRTEFQIAMKLLDDAVRVKAYDGELKREAADFWFKVGRWSDATGLLDQLERLATDPPTDEFLAEEGEEKAQFTVEDKLRRIECLRRSAAPQEEEMAIQQLSEMLGLDTVTNEFDEKVATNKEQVSAYLSLSQLMLQKRLDNEMAKKTLDQMVKVNQNDAQAYLNRSQLIRYLVQGEEGKQMWQDDVNEAYRLDSQNLACIRAMGKMYLELEQYDTAEQLVRTGLQQAESLNEKSLLYNQLVEVFIARKDLPGANQILEEAISEVPKDKDLLWKKARLLLDDATAKKREEALAEDDASRAQFLEQANRTFAQIEDMYKLMQQARIEEPRIEYLKARILMQRDGDVLRSTKRLAAVREMLSGPGSGRLKYDIDIYLSMGYLATKQYDLRLEVINRIIAAQPNAVVGHESYIQTLMVMNRNQEALKYGENLVRQIQAGGGEVSTNIQTMLMQLKMIVNIDESSEALTQADIRRLGLEVKQIYENEAIPEERRQAIAIQYFAKIKDRKQAKKLIEDTLRKDKTSYGFWALRLEYADDKEEAFKVFNAMKKNIDLKTYGNSLLRMEAKLAVKYEKESAPDVIRRVAQAADRLPAAQKASLLFELGTLQLAFLNDRPEALKLIEEANKLAPRRLDILQLLYQDASMQPDSARIDEIVERIEKVTGKDDDSYRMVEAGRILWNLDKGNISDADRDGAISRARSLVETARQHRPNFVPLLQMMARVQIAEGDLESAIVTLKEAYNMKPGDSSIIRGIASLYQQVGNRSMATTWLQKVPRSARGSQDLRTELRTLAATVKSWTDTDRKRAIQLANDLTKMSDTTTQDWMLKSRILLLGNENAAAEAAANEALKLTPDAPGAWTNLLTVLYRQKKTADIDAVFNRIRSEVSSESQSFVLGSCYANLGKFVEAESHLLKAMQQDQTNAFIKRMYAESLLSQNKHQAASKVVEDIVKTGDPVKDKEQIHWARRTIARILVDTGSYVAFNKALALIDENAEDGILSTRDLTLWVAFCFSRPEKESWDRGLIRLDQIEKRRPLNDDELFMKAQLYEKYDDDGLWQEAKNLAVSVLSRNPGNQRVVEKYVKWLLDRGELKAAKSIAMNNLKDNVVTRLRVELHSLVKAGQSEKALNLINQRAPKALQSAEDLSELLTISTIAEELGQYDPKFYSVAAQQLNELVKKAPREILRLATTMGLYGNEQSIRESLKLCMQADKFGIKDGVRGGVAVSILRKHQDKWNTSLKADVEQTGQWLAQMANANPDDLTTRWRVAEFHDMLGNLDLVESEYQTILDSPKFTNPIERGMLMNNLAYAMALNGKWEKPAQLIQEAKELIGPTSDVIDTEGFVQYVRGNFELAIVSFTQAIQDGPVTSQKFMHLALAQLKKGDREKASAAWVKASQAGLNKSKIPPALHDEYDELAAALGTQL